MSQIDEIRARRGVITPGPWVKWQDHNEVFAGPVVENNSGTIAGHRAQIADCDTDWGDWDEDEQPEGSPAANAEFIAHAPDDIDYLLAEVERLQADKAALRAVVELADRLRCELLSAITIEIGDTQSVSEALMDLDKGIYALSLRNSTAKLEIEGEDHVSDSNQA